MLTSRLGGQMPGPVQAFLDHGEDFVDRRDAAPTWSRR